MTGRDWGISSPIESISGINFVDSGGVRFIPRTGFRPTVIIVPACVPGSLDDVILDLAWALGFYRSSVDRPHVAPASVHERADCCAERLVRKLERSCRWPSRWDSEPCERYIPRTMRACR